MGTTARNFLKAACTLYGVAIVLAAAPSHATIDVSDSPLFLTVAVPPNLTVTLDDSGSMARAFVPDTCGGTSNDCSALNNRYTKSSHYNPLYYNPRVKYPPAKNADGTDRTTTFTSAYRNGFDTGFGTRNLTDAYRPSAFLDLNGSASEGYMDHYTSDVSCHNSGSPRVCHIGSGPEGRGTLACEGNTNAERDQYCKDDAEANGFPVAAYYYVFDDTNNNCNDSANDNDCYDLVIVSASSGPAAVDLNGDGAVTPLDADERQNFANWYSFARTRNLATQTAASLAFSELDPNVRVAWQALNTCRGSSTSLLDSDCDGWRNNFSGISNAIRPFTGTHKSNFYSWLHQLPTNDTTPLRNAMKRVGEYYRTSGENSPYDNDFSTGSSGEHSCRRNYHVLMTDGIWNDSATITGGNTDNATINLPVTQDGISQYTPRAPYRDTHSNTLADISFYYWANDLRTTLSNNLLRGYRDSSGTAVQNFWNPRNDPAIWQHMVNFTIGLGLTNYLDQENLTWNGSMWGGSYANLAAGTTSWPQPASDDPANVADLWHAAINSRGQFFSADDPASLSVAFRSALTAITEASGSSAALSANSTSLTGTTLVYQARFNDDWSGALIALPVASNGVVQGQVWDASTRIPAHNLRNIFTHTGADGVEFNSCGTLSTLQQTALNTNSGGTLDSLCTARMEWLRGNPQDEIRTAGGLRIFRNRSTTVMGDIVNSDPSYVKDVNYGYAGLPATTPGQSGYASYRLANATRTPMVYVGANDGHMYAIRGDQGAPDSGFVKFSYIPSGVFHNLSHLTDPSYTHRYYVDGSTTVGDAFIGGAWKTILVGGLNAGGKSIYALDVTDPETFDESKVLWEFNGMSAPAAASDAADMGLSYSRPQIGILESGDWVAIFGNGYNSTDGGAHLFIVDLATGALLRKITVADTTGDDNNGLSTPLLFDADGDKLIDSVYAGDLQGNLWKFDLSGTTSASWAISNGAPLFRASIGATGQPITAQPKVATHHIRGHLVLFGTGRYLTSDDVFNTARQTYYGIWDDPDATTTVRRSDLQVQSFDVQAAGFGRTVRSVTDNTVDWGGGRRGWYLDLLDGTGTNAPEIGERVVHTSIVAAGRVIFGSIVPSTDPCTPGGTSWLIELKLGTGGAFSNSILDLNNDGRFDSRDTLAPDSPNPQTINAVSNDSLGISNVPVWIDEDPSNTDPNRPPKAYKIRTGTTGNFATETNCAHANEALCGGGGSLRRRSWIQIR